MMGAIFLVFMGACFVASIWTAFEEGDRTGFHRGYERGQEDLWRDQQAKKEREGPTR